MARTVPIHLPLFQRFDCHQCGYCCRHLVVNVTAEDRRRIVEAGWSERMPDVRFFESYRLLGRRFHRLAHRSNGGCVFLGQDGLCRLHAETGSETKPLACRMYPFAPTPGADAVHLDLRADCPSVANNKGRSLSCHHSEITRLATEINARPMGRPPRWRGERELDLPEFASLAATFQEILQAESRPFRELLAAGSRLLGLLQAVRIGKVRGERFAELMSLLSVVAAEEAGESPCDAPQRIPPRANKLFRQWLFLHALTDDPADLAAGFLNRRVRSWHRYMESRCFARGHGPIPLLRPDWPQTDFEAVAGVGRCPDDALEPICRILRVKLDAHAFAGPAYFQYDILSGLTALWLMPAVVGWFARLEAVSRGQTALDAAAIVAGLRQTHHTFGISPVFRRLSERLRLRALSQSGIPASILAQYGP